MELILKDYIYNPCQTYIRLNSFDEIKDKTIRDKKYTLWIENCSKEEFVVDIKYNNIEKVVLYKCNISNLIVAHPNVEINYSRCNTAHIKNRSNTIRLFKSVCDLNIDVDIDNVFNVYCITVESSISSINVIDRECIYKKYYNKTIVNNIYIKNSLITFTGNGCINRIHIDNSTINENQPLYKVNQLYIDKCVFLESDIIGKFNADEQSIRNTNINFDIKDRITIYKAVYLSNKYAETTKFVILIGHTYKNSKVIKSSSGKCRTNMCVFDRVESLIGTPIKLQEGDRVVSMHSNTFTYELNKKIVVDDFDEKQRECSTGIHFFLNRDEAIRYVS